MKTIIFVNRFFYPDQSATSQMLSGLCFALADRGYNVRVITSRKYYNEHSGYSPLPARENIGGVIVTRLPAIAMGKKNLLFRFFEYSIFLLLASLHVFKQASKGCYVVAKTDPPMLGVFLWPFVYMRRANLINWFQDLFPEVFLQKSSSRIFRMGGKMLLHMRDRNCEKALLNVGLSESMLSYLNNRGISTNKLALIPNYAPAQLEPVSNFENSVTAKYSLEDYFVVGYSGNLGLAHDWRTLFEAARLLSVRDDICFVFYGGGAGMELLRKKVAIKGLANVKFFPYQPPELLSESLSSIDLHIVTLDPGMSNYIFPSKFYGIMAVKRPLVFVGDCESGISRFVEAVGCGFSIQAGDFRSLADLILRLKNDPDLLENLAGKGHEEFKRKYTLSVVAEQWSTMLASIA